MEVPPLEALLWLAQQVRMLVPNAQHIWLSSKSQVPDCCFVVLNC